MENFLIFLHLHSLADRGLIEKKYLSDILILSHNILQNSINNAVLNYKFLALSPPLHSNGVGDKGHNNKKKIIHIWISYEIPSIMPWQIIYIFFNSHPSCIGGWKKNNNSCLEFKPRVITSCKILSLIT